MILSGKPQGHRVRPMTHADLEAVLAWRNHPAVRGYMYTRREIGLDEHARWFERVSADAARHLLVFERDGIPQGFVQFHRTAPGEIAEWGFYAAPDAPAGTGRLLGQCALDHAFGFLALHKVCGQALAFNEKSVRFHLRLGFRQEGVLREQHFDGREYHDIVCFGLLAAEWLAPQRE